MKSQTSPDITRAAERYLEQYGDPIVMNTYLKVTILVLAIVSVVLAGLVYKGQRAIFLPVFWRNSHNSASYLNHRFREL